MADRKPYFGPAGNTHGGQKPYFGGASTPKPQEKKSGGILGAIERIPGATASDVGTALTGFGPGLYQSAKIVGHDVRNYGGLVGLPGTSAHPRLETPHTLSQLLVPQGKATVHDFRHPLSHPFYTAQDLLVLASLGTGAAVKAGLASGERAALTVRSPRLIAQGEGPQISKLTEKSPLSRGRQKAFHKAAALPKFQREGLKVTTRPGYERRVIGEGARYGKGIRHEAQIQGLKELPAYERYAKAFHKLNAKERQALNLIPRNVHPADLAEAWAGTKAGEIAANPELQKIILSPTPKLKVALQAQRVLYKQGEKIFTDTGQITEATAGQTPKFRGAIEQKLGRAPRPIPGAVEHYLPDVPVAIRQKDPFAGMGAGKGIPRTPGSAKLNQGILARLGKIDVSNDVLGPEFLRRVHLKVHTIVTDALRESALKFTPEELNAYLLEHNGLPKNMEYLTAPVVSKQTGRLRSQRIPGALRTPSEQEASIEGAASRGLTPPTQPSLHDLIPDASDLHRSVLTDPFSTKIRDRAYFDQQHYYLAPKSLIKAAAGQFNRSSEGVRLLVEKPLQVWRSIILGLRVGFLTNNVIGNHLIYAVRTAGIGGLRAYLNAVRETHGDATVKRLLNESYVPDRVSKQLMEEFFPEQIQGTFGKTQAPIEEGVKGRATKIGRKVGLGIVPFTQSVAETLPRRALVETMIRNSPEFKTVYKALPKEQRKFETAARKVLTGEGGREYQDLISRQVNQSLGDYLGLGPVEKNVVRNIVPFWSWYKAITQIAYHLQVDHPLRAVILARLGVIGDEDVKRALGALPSFLRGVIPLGQSGQEANVLSTSGFNPYATIPQVGAGVTEDVSQLGLAPYLSVPIGVLQHSYGKPVSTASLLNQSAQQFVQNLPPSRLAFPAAPSKLYPKRSRQSELLSYLGVPYKQPNLTEAHRRAGTPAVTSKAAGPRRPYLP